MSQKQAVPCSNRSDSWALQRFDQQEPPVQEPYLGRVQLVSLPEQLEPVRRPHQLLQAGLPLFLLWSLWLQFH
jgi:hypothetical protein